MKPQRAREPEPQWTECTSLMDWAERMLRAGYREIVRDVVRTLPAHVRGKYRDLYVRIQQEKKAEARNVSA